MMSDPWIERREIGPCTLYLGDCLEILAAGLIPVGAAIVSDPPYGIGYQRGEGGISGWAKTANIKQRTGEASKIIGDDKPFDPSPWLAFGADGARRRSSILSQVTGTSRLALLGADHYAAQLPTGEGAWYCWDKSCGGGPADSYTDMPR
jgi:site-specific DNA-methyltransferase (adenine-specific)